MIFFISLLVAFSLTGSLVIPEDVFEIGCVLLSLNVFSAIQDIAVDGLALEVLRDEHLGLGNTIQVECLCESKHYWVEHFCLKK